ncbi:MAG: orotidine-5'-phosphate decarboxylase [Lentimicrobium sp.]|jgi:orotidine-5'-phosphate decarboxylase|nr:orotidine-5'-phosphate decarboxylase [Lentimicrobium sp.]MDD2527169.1 orotidine-5'-phosphate decarboxylase [Lentimicrobiaceae bacterium]MDD4596657.1 orotidine-5'-phosphate decarboxylase [Lentimicrobiaceae bacterium]MDY0025873.1 orotidine-5'-phosphate decarboxylase [Lentimicrobium sp.]HAH59326.1 orotidine-5'-phosphate decarboxylase [Bacteroidales bacterium]
MNRQNLIQLIKKKQSFLCVGLDSDIDKIPAHLNYAEDPVFEFNRQIIDATLNYAVAYKPNLAFYESRGMEGFKSLHRTMEYLEKFTDQCFTIADAKRGDIGNTSTQYARAFFDKKNSGFDFDAVTVAPYMGEDSISPFLKFENKWVIVLALTSNKGANDFQIREDKNNQTLFEQVLRTSAQWGTPQNLMYVIGATRAEMLGKVREIVPDHFLLVPGVGAQGGSLSEVAEFGLNADCGLLVNASRSILFSSDGKDFAGRAAAEAQKMQNEMAGLLSLRGVI